MVTTVIDTVRDLLDEIAVFKEISKDLPPNYYALICSEMQTIENNLEQIHDDEINGTKPKERTKTKIN